MIYIYRTFYSSFVNQIIYICVREKHDEIKLESLNKINQKSFVFSSFLISAYEEGDNTLQNANIYTTNYE